MTRNHGSIWWVDTTKESWVVFTMRGYASAVLAVIVCLSVCLSVRLSVTSRSCTKMAKPRIRLTMPYDSPETLVFRCQKSRRNSNDITPTGAPNGGGVGSNREISTTEQLCRSDAVPPQHCIRPRWPTPTTRLRWRSDIGLLLSTTSARSRCCLYQLTMRSHGSVCISRASCFTCNHGITSNSAPPCRQQHVGPLRYNEILFPVVLLAPANAEW